MVVVDFFFIFLLSLIYHKRFMMTFLTLCHNFWVNSLTIILKFRSFRASGEPSTKFFSNFKIEGFFTIRQLIFLLPFYIKTRIVERFQFLKYSSEVSLFHFRKNWAFEKLHYNWTNAVYAENDKCLVTYMESLSFEVSTTMLYHLMPYHLSLTSSPYLFYVIKPCFVAFPSQFII